MILFTILLFALIIAAIVLLVSSGATLLVFGDLIICVLIIGLIIKAIAKKKK